MFDFILDQFVGFLSQISQVRMSKIRDKIPEYNILPSRKPTKVFIILFDECSLKCWKSILTDIKSNYTYFPMITLRCSVPHSVSWSMMVLRVKPWSVS